MTKRKRRKKSKTWKEFKDFIKSGILWISISTTLTTIILGSDYLTILIWLELPYMIRLLLV